MPEQDLIGNPVRDLGRRFAITLLLGVVVYRLGAVVPVPGVDVKGLAAWLNAPDNPIRAILLWANMFNGGAIEKASLFGLGVMPYISASIIMQLLAYSIPALKQLQKEGEVGRRKINQYTRYASVLICLAQSAIAAGALMNMPKVVPEGGPLFIVKVMMVVTTGSMVLLWLAEQITKRGIGNGVSVVIMIGILGTFPPAISEAVSDGDLTKVLAMVAVFLAIIAGMVLVTTARRRINLEQQRRVQGNRVYGGAQTQVPLMLNQAGVIPVIFASPVMVVLVWLLGHVPGAGGLMGQGSPLYRYLLAAAIIFFTYFYISITVDLNEWANNFKQSGFFIKGVKPGAKTVEFLRFRLMRITFVGALSLAAIAVVPPVLGDWLRLPGNATNAILGGIGLLIVVGVALDVIQKVSSYLLAHQYQGLINAQRPSATGGQPATGRQTAAAGGARKRF